MRFYRHLYVGKGTTREKLWKIKWKLKHNAGMFGIFIITLAEGSDQLEIWDSVYLHQPYYRTKDITIIGIAHGREEAVQLVQRMFLETFHHTGTYQVKDYIMQKMQEKR